MNEIIIDELRKTHSMRLPIGMQSSADLRLHVDHALKHICVAMTANVMKHDLKTEVFIAKYPKNWVEAVKDRWMPQFLRRRFPVQYHEERVIVNHIATFPDSSIVFPKPLGAPVWKFYSYKDGVE